MSKSRLVPPVWFWMIISISLLAYLTWAFWPAWYVPATGAVLAIVVHHVQERRALRKSVVAAQALLEPHLDALIRLAESARGDGFKLEEIVRYNHCRVIDDVSHYDLEMVDGPIRYYLDVEKVVAGSKANTINVELTISGPNDAVQSIHYPDRFVRCIPDPWLADRLEKLRSLVGNASAYETRRTYFANRGFKFPRRL